MYFGNVKRYDYTEAEYMTKNGEIFIDQVIDGQFYTFDEKGKKKNIMYKSKYIK